MNKKQITLSIAILLTIQSGMTIAKDLPEGAIQEGSLSNEKLISDAKMGVVGKMAALGCNKAESYSAYITQMPEGNVGEKVWKELWLVTGCDNTYPINIKFQEDGTGGAHWSIK
ncbi:hypothetical protein MNBD_GAMMA04-1064 [hydrothermal vent metagenome]|uniref:Uncharacterized protein n=1 Tax=hydrothermal vent metagenome TaxID=652676 RepID=A0A3B0VZC7_9ZZZZ